MKIIASTGLVLLLALIMSGFTTSCAGNGNDKTAIRIETENPYLGEILPGDDPVIFAPGIVSTPDLIEMGITFSPDGKEIYFSRSAGPEISSNFSIWVCREGKDGWETPKVASFSTHRDFAPFMMPDGRRFLRNNSFLASKYSDNKSAAKESVFALSSIAPASFMALAEGSCFLVRTARIPNTKKAPMSQRGPGIHGVSRFFTMKPTASPPQ